jgi:hypothetical protein
MDIYLVQQVWQLTERGVKMGLRDFFKKQRTEIVLKISEEERRAIWFGLGKGTHKQQAGAQSATPSSVPLPNFVNAPRIDSEQSALHAVQAIANAKVSPEQRLDAYDGVQYAIQGMSYQSRSRVNDEISIQLHHTHAEMGTITHEEAARSEKKVREWARTNR